MVKKSLFKGCIFVILIMFIVSTLNSIFIFKNGHNRKLLSGLYLNTGNEYDVVFLGSSHMNGCMNPNVLWSEYGIKSFNYATGGQPIDVTYYLLKEVLKKHNPKIVVVDLYYLGLTEKFGEEGYIRTVLDNMKFSKNKIDAVINCTPKDQWLNYIFPIFKYHSRWKSLTYDDFFFDPNSDYFQKGFEYGTNLYGKENSWNNTTKEIGNIPPKSEEYLNKFISLSKEKGVKLIFTNTPQDYNYTANAGDWQKDPDKMFNKVSLICKENNIPFINYCNMLNELNFDFRADMYNCSHLNLSGANKVSSSFGKFLNDNYQLADYRNNIKYKKWDSDYIYYCEKEYPSLKTMAEMKNSLSSCK